MSAPPKDEKARPIIIRRVSGGDHGHHGGAWKVAYADFVTAMMAFFMVMWIMGMSPETKDLIQGYFQNPVGFKKGFGAGTNPLANGNAMRHQGVNTIAVAPRESQQAQFQNVAERIRARIAADDELKSLSGNFEISVTSEGLRIEMTDAGSGETFFAIGSASPREPAMRALGLIGDELGKIGNPVILEGHTDARQYGTLGYSNWELSAARANAARRVIVDSGVVSDRVAEVRGYADRHLRFPDRPLDPANRRVSILLPFETATPEAGTEPAGQDTTNVLPPVPGVPVHLNLPEHPLPGGTTPASGTHRQPDP